MVQVNIARLFRMLYIPLLNVISMVLLLLQPGSTLHQPLTVTVSTSQTPAVSVKVRPVTTAATSGAVLSGNTTVIGPDTMSRLNMGASSKPVAVLPARTTQLDSLPANSQLVQISTGFQSTQSASSTGKPLHCSGSLLVRPSLASNLAPPEPVVQQGLTQLGRSSQPLLSSIARSNSAKVWRPPMKQLAQPASRNQLKPQLDFTVSIT